MDSKEALAQKIFECADHEYSAYIEEMKSHDVGYIVDHAYEIVIMSDLRIIFEEDDLSLSALQELDKLERPLASIYDDWLKNDCGYMEQLRKTVGSFTEKRLREMAQRYYADPAIPRYGKGFSEAQECDEVHLYHASRRRDVECIRYYDGRIHDAHDSHSGRSSSAATAVNSYSATRFKEPTGMHDMRPKPSGMSSSTIILKAAALTISASMAQTSIRVLWIHHIEY